MPTGEEATIDHAAGTVIAVATTPATAGENLATIGTGTATAGSGTIENATGLDLGRKTFVVDVHRRA